MEGCQVREYQNATGVEAEDHACFFDIGDRDGVDAEADGFAGAEDAAEYTL